MRARREAEVRMDEDREHLRLLAIGYYVLGALSILSILVPLCLAIIGAAAAVALAEGAEAVGEIFEGGAGVIIATVVLLAVGFHLIAGLLLLLTGSYLANRQHRTFCIVVALLACLWVPVGTILGVFTIVVLQRPSVMRLFGVDVPDKPERREDVNFLRRSGG